MANVGVPVDHLVEALGDIVTCYVDDKVTYPGKELDDVSISVDDGMVKFVEYPCDFRCRFVVHRCAMLVVSGSGGTLLRADLEVFEGDALVDADVAGETQYPVSDDVALDLVGASGDSTLQARQCPTLPATIGLVFPGHSAGTDDFHGDVADLVHDGGGGELADGTAGSRGLTRCHLSSGAHRNERLTGLHGVDPHELLAQHQVADETAFGGFCDELVGSIMSDASSGTGADGDAFVHQHGGSHVPAVVETAEQVVCGDLYVGEEDFVEVAATVDLVNGANLHSGDVHRHNEHRDASVFCDVWISAGDYHAVVADVSEGGPYLLAVDDPGVAVAFCSGLKAGNVGSCPWF